MNFIKTLLNDIYQALFAPIDDRFEDDTFDYKNADFSGTTTLCDWYPYRPVGARPDMLPLYFRFQHEVDAMTNDAKFYGIGC